MSSSLAVLFSRIVASEKLPDRLLASGIVPGTGSMNLSDQVILAYVFEITKPWFPTSKLISTLVETLTAEHAKLKPSEPLDDQFELLLRNVNQELNALSEDGETDWIGSLNGMIMVMSGSELHFSQTGRCPAYLLQNNRIRQITDDTPPAQEPHPLRTFSNLASGNIVEGDHILVANQELYNEISLDALRRIINSGTPFTACQSITRELRREKNPNVSAFIFRFDLPDVVAASKESTEVVLEEEMQSAIKKIGKKISPFTAVAKKVSQRAGQTAVKIGKHAGAASVAAAHKSGQFTKEKIAPKANELLSKLIEKEEPKTEEVEDTSVQSPSERPVVEIIPSKKRAQQAHLQALAEAVESRLENEDDEIFEEEQYRHPTEPVAQKQTQTGFDFQGVLSATKQFFLTTIPNAIVDGIIWFRNWLKTPLHKRIAALVLGVLILTTTVWVIIARNSTPANPKTDSKKVEQVITDVSEKTDRLATVITQKQDIEAGKLATDIETQLYAVQDPTAEQKKQIDELWLKLHSLTDPLNGIVRLSTAIGQYQFKTEAKGFLINLPYFYGWNSTSSQLLRTGKGEASDIQTNAMLPDSNDIITSATNASGSDTAIGYFLTRQYRVYKLTQTSSQLNLTEVKPASGDFATGDVISTFNGHLYILDGKTGLLWKYANNGGQFSKGTSTIDINKYDIKKSISFAIDGSIYFLRNSEVMKFTSGKQDTAFVLRDQPYQMQTLVQPLQIISNETFSSIYVLDGGLSSVSESSAHILEFSKAGSYIGAYALPKEYTSLRWFAINPKEKKLWVLNNQTVSEFNLP